MLACKCTKHDMSSTHWHITPVCMHAYKGDSPGGRYGPRMGRAAGADPTDQGGNQLGVPCINTSNDVFHTADELHEGGLLPWVAAATVACDMSSTKSMQCACRLQHSNSSCNPLQRSLVGRQSQRAGATSGTSHSLPALGNVCCGGWSYPVSYQNLAEGPPRSWSQGLPLLQQTAHDMCAAAP